MQPPADIRDRKDQHLDLVLASRGAGTPVSSGFDAIRFEHCALPEIDFDAIDLSASFLGYRLRAPFLISSMTGGTARAARINRHLAEAAESCGIALAVGSQRIAVEGRGGGGLDRTLRDAAPSVPLLGNIGAGQLVAGWGADEARRAVEMIGADALIVHLNPLQEAVQPGGDRRWRGVLAAIERLAAALDVPIVAKEVGAGISGRLARRLLEAGVVAVDVAGAGGTSWAAIEAERIGDPAGRASALLFADWGIPTAQAIADVRRQCPEAVVIGSGGVRHGLDAARALRLGADLVGQAGASLSAAELSGEAAARHFSQVAQELRISCFCTGSPDLAALRQAPLLPG
ncbi:type 2 isopentenyl-diphosphate Delta-isomerase [Aureimonas jatrophae]|uniref:Isopentenyl-diphosphate delta-isomerase n=1 Tax=Aureimonas jatrophae TaxID=1166073 RepID=A0A1H0DPR8_9HYPH|nr:type 2 isopentenyl-diphosphate Delta-isomerase [Aureimonas jatrophae]MBB3952014.1 isopentenyl-diphosphate delta-isomerase [Aureimonas jatrophae]SDN72180.1 isopentenyl-diphosphate delta-isomerase [Aureimonas jatrophae]